MEITGTSSDPYILLLALVSGTDSFTGELAYKTEPSPLIEELRGWIAVIRLKITVKKRLKGHM